MEALCRYVNAALMGAVSLFAPAAPMICCALAFICVDFVTGVFADRRLARAQRRRWFFESCQAWRTVRKAGFVIIAIAMAWLLECCVLDFVELHLARLFAGFVCGVEMWSFLENAAHLSDAPLFEQMRRYVQRRVKRQLDDDELFE